MLDLSRSNVIEGTNTSGDPADTNQTSTCAGETRKAAYCARSGSVFSQDHATCIEVTPSFRSAEIGWRAYEPHAGCDAGSHRRPRLVQQEIDDSGECVSRARALAPLVENRRHGVAIDDDVRERSQSGLVRVPAI
jgi:hypothetical protein